MIKGQRVPLTSEEVPDTFKQFLIDRSLLDQFLSNVNQRRNADYYNPRKVFWKWEEQYVARAFEWSDTSEGFDFWSAVSKEWVGFIRIVNLLEGGGENNVFSTS